MPPRSRRTKVASSAPRDVSSSSTLPTSTTITEETNQVMPPKMRGRGRPPKKKATEQPLKTDEDSTNVEGVEDAVPPKTRGRGRPPKNKAVGKPSQATKESALIKEAEEEVDQEAVSVSKTNIRTRGRPIMKKTAASAGQQSALEALKQRRDAAMKTKKSKECSSVAPPAPKSNALQELLRASSTSKSSDEGIMSTPAAKSTPAQRERTPMSRLDTEEDLYGLSPGGEASRLRLESQRKNVQHSHSVLKAQGTPAVETSILALTNFKRRPRQGSIIRMVQQTSELGDPEEHLVVDAEDPLLQGLENTLNDFEDFNPDNESTPLHLGKRKSDVRADEPRTSSSRKRKHAQDDEEIQVPQSSPPVPSSPPARHQSSSHSSTSASLPEVVESTQKLLEVDIYSENMAPPQSSSEPASPVRSQTHAEKRRKLSIQHGQENKNDGSPSPTQSKKHKSRKKAPVFSTAALQSLLPKPRRKARAARHTDEYDIPSSDDENDAARTLQDSDDDELAHPKARRRATKTPMRKISGNRKKAAKSVSPASTRKKTPSAKAKWKEPENVKVKKTYGHAAVEKENDDNVEVSSDHDSDDEDADTGAVDGGKKRAESVVLSNMFNAKELQEAKKKFAEVDDFEMEFESVDLGGGSSSPWR